jgi:hypothetical protein
VNENHKTDQANECGGTPCERHPSRPTTSTLNDHFQCGCISSHRQARSSAKLPFTCTPWQTVVYRRSESTLPVPVCTRSRHRVGMLDIAPAGTFITGRQPFCWLGRYESQRRRDSDHVLSPCRHRQAARLLRRMQCGIVASRIAEVCLSPISDVIAHAPWNPVVLVQLQMHDQPFPRE